MLNRWRENCYALYNHKANGDSSVQNCPQTHTEDVHSNLRKEVEAVVVIVESEISWILHHPIKKKKKNHRCNDNLHQDLADRRMDNPMDPVFGHHTSQERQPAAVPELPNDQSHQPPKQSHAVDHTEQIEATSGEDNH